MMIHAYLRASTNEQDAQRARDALERFVDERGERIAGFYAENVTGTKIERPELNKILDVARDGDVLLIEAVDRLTRLNEADWSALRRKIDDKGLLIVALDVPTSHVALDSAVVESFSGQMLKIVNSMMLDMLAVISRKDYEDRRRRQAEGIARKKAATPEAYQGKRADSAKHKRVLALRSSGASLTAIQVETGYSRSQVCKIIKANGAVKGVGVNA